MGMGKSNYLLVAIWTWLCYYSGMGRADKLLQRFLSKPKDFSYDELKRLLYHFGYEETEGGKSSGSRATFFNIKTGHTIKFHKPHPKPILKVYQIREIENILKERGVLL